MSQSVIVQSLVVETGLVNLALSVCWECGASVIGLRDGVQRRHSNVSGSGCDSGEASFPC